jgi:hypothetical protein
VRPIVESLARSTIPSSTTLFFSSRNVQRARPCGGTPTSPALRDVAGLKRPSRRALALADQHLKLLTLLALKPAGPTLHWFTKTGAPTSSSNSARTGRSNTWPRRLPSRSASLSGQPAIACSRWSEVSSPSVTCANQNGDAGPLFARALLKSSGLSTRSRSSASSQCK